ncbi:transmembrane protein 119b [Syngnathoides biaculeatus]|uniref:transmembrane protein 119b n=1 Tax=Syngnathoides biaculeatus TaxID=300417 RepID=UPI002ADD562F|nr:transmembrane protein 119b [Syngnathoides biaculeatus]
MNLALYDSAEGSADFEEPDVVTASVGPPDRRSATSHFLVQMVDFLRDHMFSVLAAVSLLLILALAACAVVFLTRRRRGNAYYPSSYPAKMYVDQLDKNGGVRGFREVLDKKKEPASDGDSEPVDSHKQLQADIVRAAKSLRTPTRTLEDASKKDESPPSPVAERAGEAVGPPPGGDATNEPGHESRVAAAVKDLRPPSLHLHNDSATLQLIAGEKTAF